MNTAIRLTWKKISQQEDHEHLYTKSNRMFRNGISVGEYLTNKISGDCNVILYPGGMLNAPGPIFGAPNPRVARRILTEYGLTGKIPDVFDKMPEMGGPSAFPFPFQGVVGDD